MGGIIKAITFQASPHIAGLEAAIARFVATDGNLDRTAPAAFLNEDERGAVWKGGKFRISLYKVLLFRHVAGAIKSGSLNLEQSHKRRPLESYLIDRTRWMTEREELLDRSGMSGFQRPSAGAGRARHRTADPLRGYQSCYRDGFEPALQAAGRQGLPGLDPETG